MTTSKTDIRRKILLDRKSLSYDFVNINSDIICDKIINSLYYKNASVILLYFDYNNEVCVKRIFEKALCDNKIVAFPVSYIQDGIPQMDFYCVNDINSFVKGYKGIFEPDRSKDNVTLLAEVADLCIVPFVAADSKCHRIGYGKGFYDRYLGSHNITNSIGVGFDMQIVEAISPDDNDFQLDYIYTEKEIYRKG